MPRKKKQEKKFPPLPKDPEPMMIIHELSHIMRKAVTEKCRALFCSDAGHDIIRELVRKDGVTQLDLVKITHYTAPSISVSLQKLEEKQYVRRTPDPADRRAIRVYITEKGREADAEMFQTIKDFESQTMIGISAEERELLIKMLLIMRENVLPPECKKAAEQE